MIGSAKNPGLSNLAKSPAVRALAAVVAVLGLTLAYADRHVLVSPQGSQCLRAAWSLSTTGALDVAPGRPFAWFGPLYPVCLSALGRAGLPPLGAVAFVNSVALVAMLALFAALARRVAPRSANVATLFFALLATNAYLYRMARPDLVMIPAILLAIWGLARYAEHGRRHDLLLAALGCALATTARYMAMFALAPLVLTGIVLAWRRGRSRIFETLLFVGVACVPVLLWLLRNQQRTGHLSGMARAAPREAAMSADFLTNLLRLLKTFALDLFGVRSMGVVSQVYGESPLPHPKATAIVAGIAMSCALIGVLLALRKRRSPSPAPSDFTVRLVAWTAGAYLIALLVLWTWGNNDPIHTRYAAPMYGLVVLLAFRAAEGTARPARIAFALAALAILLPNVEKSARLMGESPGDALIRVSLHGEGDLWKQGLLWEDVAAWVAPPGAAGP